MYVGPARRRRSVVRWTEAIDGVGELRRGLRLLWYGRPSVDRQRGHSSRPELRSGSLRSPAWDADPWPLAPLAAGETRGGEDSPLRIPVRLNDPPNPNPPCPYDPPKQPRPLGKPDFENEGNFKIAIGQLQKIWLKYEDSFGRIFYAAHDMNRLQPWVTFAEVSGKGTSKVGSLLLH